jgi:STE24 endopeptidase
LTRASHIVYVLAKNSGGPVLRTFSAVLVLLLYLLAAAAAQSSAPASANTPAATAQSAAPPPTGPAFDVNAAVNAYLAKVPADQRARSDAYFEGGYWLLLWDFLYLAVLCLLFLNLGISARMRDFAERLTRFRPLQTLVYWVQFILLFSIASFPLGVYEGFIREKKYGLMNQTFGGWLRDQSLMLLVNLVLGGILLMLLVGIVRKLGRNWWVWGAIVSIAFLAFASLIAPVFVFPLFNKFTRLNDPKITAPILSMARANGIPAKDVWEFDASKQSKRVSANVSGFANTMRISLNDNLLKRCTLPEIEAVMGHEMGHYVLNHGYKGLVMEGVLFVIGFAFLNWGINRALARWGEKWRVRGISDVAVLPLAILVIAFYFFITTPIDNTITRTMEYEADMFGLNASQQPDGEAEVDLMLGEYRKLDPGKLEEMIFFDHPSGRTRINAAMRWKAEHLTAASPQ